MNHLPENFIIATPTQEIFDIVLNKLDGLFGTEWNPLKSSWWFTHKDETVIVFENKSRSFGSKCYATSNAPYTNYPFITLEQLFTLPPHQEGFELNAECRAVIKDGKVKIIHKDKTVEVSFKRIEEIAAAMKPLPDKFQIRIPNLEVSRIVQEKLFSLGHRWQYSDSANVSLNFYGENSYIHIGYTFESKISHGSHRDDFKTLTLDELFSTRQQEFQIGDMTAKVTPKSVVAGCQTFSKEQIQRLVEEINKSK